MSRARREAVELEDEVRAVARKIDRSRQLTLAPLRLLALAFGADPTFGCAGCAVSSISEVLLLLGAALALIFLLAVPYLIALPIIALYRHRYQLRLRRLITEIPDDQRVEVLDALFSEGDETAAIVSPVLRRLNLPYEMVPAARPGGRGDELRSG
jgi:HAMP domain-containing protein